MQATSEKNPIWTSINLLSVFKWIFCPKAQEADLSVKIMLQPLEIDFNFEFFINMLEFNSVFESAGLLQDRALYCRPLNH